MPRIGGSSAGSSSGNTSPNSAISSSISGVSGVGGGVVSEGISKARAKQKGLSSISSASCRAKMHPFVTARGETGFGGTLVANGVCEGCQRISQPPNRNEQVFALPARAASWSNNQGRPKMRLPIFICKTSQRTVSAFVLIVNGTSH